MAVSGTARRSPSTVPCSQLSVASIDRWVWESIRPGRSVASPRSITFAPAGMGSPGPAALILPPSTITTPLAAAVSLRPSNSRAALRTTTSRAFPGPSWAGRIAGRNKNPRANVRKLISTPPRERRAAWYPESGQGTTEILSAQGYGLPGLEGGRPLRQALETAGLGRLPDRAESGAAGDRVSRLQLQGTQQEAGLEPGGHVANASGLGDHPLEVAQGLRALSGGDARGRHGRHHLELELQVFALLGDRMRLPGSPPGLSGPPFGEERLREQRQGAGAMAAHPSLAIPVRRFGSQ